LKAIAVHSGSDLKVVVYFYLMVEFETSTMFSFDRELKM